MAQGMATIYGAAARIEYSRGCPEPSNHLRETGFAVVVTNEIAGRGKVDRDRPPIMAGKIFAFIWPLAQSPKAPA
jgi:hippurate hydrolase